MRKGRRRTLLPRQKSPFATKRTAGGNDGVVVVVVFSPSVVTLVNVLKYSHSGRPVEMIRRCGTTETHCTILCAVGTSRLGMKEMCNASQTCLHTSGLCSCSPDPCRRPACAHQSRQLPRLVRAPLARRTRVVRQECADDGACSKQASKQQGEG